MFEPARWADFQTQTGRGYVCTSAPLTCPGHLSAPVVTCQPPPVRATEVDVISRQMPSHGAAQVHLVDAVFDRTGSPAHLRLDPPSVNVSLLLDVLAFLDRNRNRWTQHRYLADVDGIIVGCVAGWAVVLGGGMHLSSPEFILSARDGLELHRRARELLDLSEWQAGAVFGFTHSPTTGAHPTFRELCEHIYDTTKVRYEPRGAAA